MKKHPEALPLLRKPPILLLFLIPVLFALLTGLLYLPAPKEESSSPQAEQTALEEALALAREKEASATEEDKAALRQEILFYESALQFGLSPWSSYFASEGLFAYTSLLREGKAEKAADLARILDEKDAEGLIRYLDAKRRAEGNLSEEEAKDARERDVLLMEAVAPFSAGSRALLYDLSLLRESLRRGKDLYFGTEKSLTARDESLFSSLEAIKTEALRQGKTDPVPANAETVTAGERIAALFLTLLLLLVLGNADKEKSRGFPLLSLGLPALVSLLLCTAALTASTAFFASGTLHSAVAAFAGRAMPLPFFLAVFLRLSLRILSDLPLFLLFFFLRNRRGKGRDLQALALLPLSRFLLQSAAPLLPKALARLLTLTDLSESLFPSLAAYALRPASPLLTVLLWGSATVALLLLLRLQKQKA